MGHILSSLFGSREVRVVMLGLDNAGKTTILYRLKLGEHVSTMPSLGFNVETITFKKVRFNVWDVGGQDKLRTLWSHYFAGTQALIFVIDCSDIERLEIARDELWKVITDKAMRDAVLLVYCNKSDRPRALPLKEITDRLLLGNITDRFWHVQSTCAVTGQGLVEGLSWLSAHIP
ncbi:ADP-ribosylation factor 6 [Pelomyxa schiedti]|nr:ADP-ribosylation factor 6 [Pelomyxa schiedti]